jgi:hypothetical protein
LQLVVFLYFELNWIEWVVSVGSRHDVTYTVCHLNNNVDEVSASLALSYAAQVSMWSFGKVQRAWGADWKGTVNMRCMPDGERVGCASEAFVSFFLNHHHSAPIFLVFMGSNPWGWSRTPHPRSYNWHFLHKFWLWMICGSCNSLEVSAIDSDCSCKHEALLQCVHNLSQPIRLINKLNEINQEKLVTLCKAKKAGEV